MRTAGKVGNVFIKVRRGKAMEKRDALGCLAGLGIEFRDFVPTIRIVDTRGRLLDRWGREWIFRNR